MRTLHLNIMYAPGCYKRRHTFSAHFEALIKHKSRKAQHVTTSLFHTACHLHRNLYNQFFYTEARLYRLSFFLLQCLQRIFTWSFVGNFILYLNLFYGRCSMFVFDTPPLTLRCCVVAVCCKDFAWRGSRSNNSQITRNRKQTADRLREWGRERERRP